MLITETAEMEIDSEFYSLFCDEINSLARNPSVDKLRLFLAVTTSTQHQDKKIFKIL